MNANELIKNYCISSNGTVINKITKRVLKQDLSTGYASVVLSNKGYNIGTTDYVVYQKENILTLEVL